MKILVYCPLHPKTPKLFGRTNQSIFRLEYDPLEIHFSKGDNPYSDDDDPRVYGRANILHNYQKARRMALDGGYDAMLTVEYDMVIPADTVQRLLACESDVAYGLYCFRATNTWSAFQRLDQKSGRSLSKDPDLARSLWGQRYESQGVGLGCTLIRRHVLEAFDFRTDLNQANDWDFAVDCQEHGFKQVHDLGVVCGHITTNPSPRILWPDPDQPRLYRNDFLDTIPVNERGEVELEIGQLGEFYIPKDALVKRVDGE